MKITTSSQRLPNNDTSFLDNPSTWHYWFIPVASRLAAPSPSPPLGVRATAGALARWLFGKRDGVLNNGAPSFTPRSPTHKTGLTAEQIEAGVARCERNPGWWLAAARIRRDDAAEAYRRRDYARQDEDIRVALAYERRAAEARTKEDGK